MPPRSVSENNALSPYLTACVAGVMAEINNPLLKKTRLLRRSRPTSRVGFLKPIYRLETITLTDKIAKLTIEELDVVSEYLYSYDGNSQFIFKVLERATCRAGR